MIQPQLFVHLSNTEGDVNQTNEGSNDQWLNVKIQQSEKHLYYFSTLDMSDDSTNADSDCEGKWIREMDHEVHSLLLFLTFLRQLYFCSMSFVMIILRMW